MLVVYGDLRTQILNVKMYSKLTKIIQFNTVLKMAHKGSLWLLKNYEKDFSFLLLLKQIPPYFYKTILVYYLASRKLSRNLTSMPVLLRSQLVHKSHEELFLFKSKQNINIWASTELLFKKKESLSNKITNLKDNFCLFYYSKLNSTQNIKSYKKFTKSKLLSQVKSEFCWITARLVYIDFDFIIRSYRNTNS